MTLMMVLCSTRDATSPGGAALGGVQYYFNALIYLWHSTLCCGLLLLPWLLVRCAEHRSLPQLSHNHISWLRLRWQQVHWRPLGKHYLT
jgi:hypothetical protein